MDLNLKGKIAIVTDAGRDIGRTLALTFAKEGFQSLYSLSQGNTQPLVLGILPCL